MDFLFNGYKSCVYNTILMVINRYTKVTIYLFITKTVNLIGFIDFMYCYIFLRYGWPEGIVSNRKIVFISVYWAAVCDYIKVKKRLSIAFYF